MDLVVIALTMNVNKKHVCLFLIPDFPMTWKKRYKKRYGIKVIDLFCFFREEIFTSMLYKEKFNGG